MARGDGARHPRARRRGTRPARGGSNPVAPTPRGVRGVAIGDAPREGSRARENAPPRRRTVASRGDENMVHVSEDEARARATPRDDAVETIRHEARDRSVDVRARRSRLASSPSDGDDARVARRRVRTNLRREHVARAVRPRGAETRRGEDAPRRVPRVARVGARRTPRTRRRGSIDAVRGETRATRRGDVFRRVAIRGGGGDHRATTRRRDDVPARRGRHRGRVREVDGVRARVRDGAATRATRDGSNPRTKTRDGVWRVGAGRGGDGGASRARRRGRRRVQRRARRDDASGDDSGRARGASGGSRGASPSPRGVRRVPRRRSSRSRATVQAVQTPQAVEPNQRHARVRRLEIRDAGFQATRRGVSYRRATVRALRSRARVRRVGRFRRRRETRRVARARRRPVFSPTRVETRPKRARERLSRVANHHDRVASRPRDVPARVGACATRRGAGRVGRVAALRDARQAGASRDVANGAREDAGRVRRVDVARGGSTRVETVRAKGGSADASRARSRAPRRVRVVGGCVSVPSIGASISRRRENSSDEETRRRRRRQVASRDARRASHQSARRFRVDAREEPTDRSRVRRVARGDGGCDFRRAIGQTVDGAREVGARQGMFLRVATPRRSTHEAVGRRRTTRRARRGVGDVSRVAKDAPRGQGGASKGSRRRARDGEISRSRVRRRLRRVARKRENVASASSNAREDGGSVATQMDRRRVSQVDRSGGGGGAV